LLKELNNILIPVMIKSLAGDTNYRFKLNNLSIAFRSQKKNGTKVINSNDIRHSLSYFNQIL